MPLLAVSPTPAGDFSTSKLLQASQYDADIEETSARVLEVIYKYLMTKFGDPEEKISQGTPKFLAVISKFVSEAKTIQMCLPAFPWKSANKVYKVLGSLPDKAEEVALRRLNTMCVEIAEVYKPGATLTIISDGLVYNGKPHASPEVLYYDVSLIVLLYRPPQYPGPGYIRLRRGSASNGCDQRIPAHPVFAAEGSGVLPRPPHAAERSGVRGQC